MRTNDFKRKIIQLSVIRLNSCSSRGQAARTFISLPGALLNQWGYSTVPFQTKTLTWGSKGSCGNRARKNRDLNKKEVVEKKKNRGRLERRSRGRRKDRERWGTQ